MATVFLEFERTNDDGTKSLAALGSDTIFHRDGRWSHHTFVRKVHERVDQLRSIPGSSFRSVTLVGYTVAGTNYVGAPRVIPLPRY